MADEPKVDEDEAEPLSSRDVELEPVSLRDIEMILAPGKAPPLLSKPETLADKMKRLEAAKAKEAGNAGADAPTRPDTPALIKSEEKKKAPAPPPRKAEPKAEAKEPADLDKALERAKAPLPAPQPKDSGLEDLRTLAASHPPPAKKVDAVDFESVLRDDDVPPPPPPLPPDLTALQGGEVKAKVQPKAPLKKRDAKKESDAEAAPPPASERPPRSAPGSKRPSARSERPRTTGVPAKSIEPSRPSSSVRPDKSAPAAAPASGGGRTILIGVGAVVLLGLGYFLGKSNEQPAAPTTPAATVTVTVTVTAPAPPPPETAAASEPTAEPEASASAAPVASHTSTALPTALTGALPTAVGTATSKPTATPGGGEFDKAAASAALSGAMGQAAACKKEGDPSGKAQVSVTFAPSGKVTIANVNGPPFAGTATGGCIAKAFRSASVAPFSGDPVTVSKTVNIP